LYQIVKSNAILILFLKLLEKVSFIENQVSWHHRVPNDEEYQAALKELDERSAQYE